MSVAASDQAAENTKSRADAKAWGRVVDTADAALFLGRTQKTLRSWRCRRLGPTYLRIGPPDKAGRHRILYRVADLRRFLQAEAVVAARMPRPMGGRMPGGRNRPKQGSHPQAG